MPSLIRVGGGKVQVDRGAILAELVSEIRNAGDSLLTSVSLAGSAASLLSLFYGDDSGFADPDGSLLGYAGECLTRDVAVLQALLARVRAVASGADDCGLGLSGFPCRYCAGGVCASCSFAFLRPSGNSLER